MADLNITLTNTEEEDLNLFYQFQLNEEANYLAAFTFKDPNNKAAYIEKYTKLLHDPTVNMKTIKMNDEIVGSVAKFFIKEEAAVSYWIDQKFWGQGITSAALKDFLAAEKIRPVYAYVAFDNYGSQRVLEKNGFVKIGTDRGFANARQTEIEEYIYRLLE